MTDEREPLAEFRAYYTRERAAGSEEVAIGLSKEETGLYSMLRRAYYAGWEARAKVPPPPPEVPQGVIDALSTLRAWVDSIKQPTMREKAVAAGLGALADAQKIEVHVSPTPAAALPPLPMGIPGQYSPANGFTGQQWPGVHQPAAPSGPPPVTHLADYKTEEAPMGATCPTCQSVDKEIKLPAWNGAFAEYVACPDRWHNPGSSVMEAITGRIKRVAKELSDHQESD